MLKLTDIDAFHGQAQILNSVNLEVQEGQVVALLGRNGSGRSSILRAIMGLLPIASGQITFLERSSSAARPRPSPAGGWPICRTAAGSFPT